MCRKLVEFYGFDMVNGWKFRIRTEPNGAHRGCGHTFDGDHEDFVEYYMHTVRAVKKVLPGARIGPGEFRGCITKEGHRPPVVDYIRLARESDEIGLPMDFLANSSHSIPHFKNNMLVGGADPRFRAEWSVKSFENLSGANEKLRQVPKYIFQFGPLCRYIPFLGKNVDSLEPGGRGAAWRFFTLLEMKQKLPETEGIWHWGAVENLYDINGGEIHYPIPDSEFKSGSKLIMAGNGWLYSVFDCLDGADILILDLPDSEDGTMYKILWAEKGSRYHLIAASYNIDRTVHNKTKLNIRLPSSFSPKGTIKAGTVDLSDRNSSYMQIKKDLARAGFLKDEYASCDVLANIYSMTDKKGVDYLICNYEKYEKIQEELLSLKPFYGLKKTDAGYLAELELEASAIAVVRLEISE